jgi:catechol 2,3-dioxygenase-like lactoylglutathione lyase family enzyme
MSDKNEGRMAAGFQHLGLSIVKESDIREFYQDILGLEIRRKFFLQREIASQVFQQDREIAVVAGMIGNLYLEIFLINEKSTLGCEHICLTIPDRAKLVARCRSKHFPVTVIRREPLDLIFIQDASGNRFEVKQQLA